MANVRAPRVYAQASFASDPTETKDLVAYAILKMWNTLGTDGVAATSDIGNVLTQTQGIFGLEDPVYKIVAEYLAQFEVRPR